MCPLSREIRRHVLPTGNIVGVRPPIAGAVVPAETHIDQAPLDRQGVFELIRDQLADILETDPSTITEGASFAEDLDADSLALIELVEALEEELGERTVGFRIDDEDLEDLRTVRDAVDYVYAKLGAG
jgi:acyl carrier protein